MIAKQFVTGINYWPKNKAMYWWKNYDKAEVENDFKQLCDNNFGVIRIFLTWEDYQPKPDKISISALDNLRRTADIAEKYDLFLMPTFFCGHMSGINWIPEWMTKPSDKSGRFLVYSNNRISNDEIINFYRDPEIIAAQKYQIEKVCSALNGHRTIHSYDLGNEPSNCVIPPSQELGQNWLKEMVECIKKSSLHSLVTIGMHAEDLEENRNMSPFDAGLYCDYLSMHGYPFYLSWVEDDFDYEILPFLAIITKWLGEKPVLFQEFGIPTQSLLKPVYSNDYQRNLKCPLWDEKDAAIYYKKSLERLYEVGCIGAFSWCYADYHPNLWDRPPVDNNVHERHFGMYRYDNTPKLQVQTFKDFKYKPINEFKEYVWLNEYDKSNFYDNPKVTIAEMYRKYKYYVENGRN